MKNTLSKVLARLEAEIDYIMVKYNVPNDHLSENGETGYIDQLMMAKNYVHEKYLEALIDETIKDGK